MVAPTRKRHALFKSVFKSFEELPALILVGYVFVELRVLIYFFSLFDRLRSFFFFLKLVSGSSFWFLSGIRGRSFGKTFYFLFFIFDSPVFHLYYCMYRCNCTL